MAEVEAEGLNQDDEEEENEDEEDQFILYPEEEGEAVAEGIAEDEVDEEEFNKNMQDQSDDG